MFANLFKHFIFNKQKSFYFCSRKNWIKLRKFAIIKICFQSNKDAFTSPQLTLRPSSKMLSIKNHCEIKVICLPHGSSTHRIHSIYFLREHWQKRNTISDARQKFHSFKGNRRCEQKRKFNDVPLDNFDEISHHLMRKERKLFFLSLFLKFEDENKAS